MPNGQTEYRLVALVRTRELKRAWTEERATVDRELELIQDAQQSGEAIRLPWLGVARGDQVSVVYVEESEPLALPASDPDYEPFFRRDMKF